MRDQGAEGSSGTRLVRLVGAGLLVVAFAAMASRAVNVLLAAIATVRYPLSLDYGEGIVVQQALMITQGHGYGDITSLPFIVFHYPPIYHLLLRALAVLGGSWGIDDLIAGRIISIGATVAIAGCVGLLAGAACGPRGRGVARIAGGTVAALLVFAPRHVAEWMPFARVDMLSIAFSFLGLLLAATAVRSPWRLRLAVLCFVLAIFTKQTAIAAPLAAVLVLLIRDRRQGLEAIALGMVLGAGSLVCAQWLTDGRFLQHIVGYNVNRFSWGALQRLLVFLPPHFLLISTTLVGLVLSLRAKAAEPSDDRTDRRAVEMLAVHFVICSAMLGMAAKSGASFNYFIEWFCSGAAFAGIAFGTAVRRLFEPSGSVVRPIALPAFVSVSLALQATALPNPWHRFPLAEPRSAQTVEDLLQVVRESPGDVISDDMALLLRAGRRVVWEPAIFAELGSMGRWDEGLIVQAVRDGRVTLAITEGKRGDLQFDQRYNPAVAAAIYDVLPIRREIGRFTVHLPMLPTTGAVPATAGR